MGVVDGGVGVMDRADGTDGADRVPRRLRPGPAESRSASSGSSRRC